MALKVTKQPRKGSASVNWHSRAALRGQRRGAREEEGGEVVEPEDGSVVPLVGGCNRGRCAVVRRRRRVSSSSFVHSW